MPAIVTQTFKNRQVDAFLNFLSDKNAYIFVGNPYQWEDETSPPIPVDNDGSFFNVWDKVYGLKLVPQGSYGKVIRRRDWRPGDVYDIYSTNMGPIEETSFYVMHEYNVYKCIWNNDGSPSTDPPTGTDNLFETNDGYVWAFMYTIDTSNAQKYLTPEYMPVIIDSAVQQNAEMSTGIVTGVRVIDPGTGFTSIDATSPGMSRAAELYPTMNASGGIESVEVIDGGSGYSTPVSVVVTGNGVGASLVATVSGDGRISSITVGNSGTGYIQPAIDITAGSGTGFHAIPVIQNGQLTRVHIKEGDEGDGYTFLSLAVVGGADAAVEPILAPILGHGYNAEEELGASNIMFTALFSPSEVAGYIPPNNQYRDLGLILDPEVNPATMAEPMEGVIFENPVGTNLVKLKQHLTSEGTFLRNELIRDTVTNALGKIVHWDEAAGEVWLIRTQQENFIPFTVGHIVEGTDLGKQFQVAEIIEPGVAKYTGQIHYIEQREPVQRTASQFEEIKIVIEF